MNLNYSIVENLSLDIFSLINIFNQKKKKDKFLGAMLLIQRIVQ